MPFSYDRIGGSPVEKVVIVVDAEVGAPCSTLNDTLHIIQHVNVRIPGKSCSLDLISTFSQYLDNIPGQHTKLPSVKEGDQKLPQGVFPPSPVWVRHHCIISIVIVAKFEVVAEEDVGESGSLRVMLRCNCQPRLRHHDHHVWAGELLQESDDAEEVGDGQVVAG